MSGQVARHWRPFWIHQGAEYLVGLVLVASGVQSPDPGVPTLAGGLIVLNAAVVMGPLGAFRLVSRPLHRLLDIGVIAVLVTAAALPMLDVDSVSRVVMLLVAAILALLWFGTNFETRPATAQRRRDARAALASDRSEAIGRTAGRLVAKAAQAARDRRDR